MERTWKIKLHPEEVRWCQNKGKERKDHAIKMGWKTKSYDETMAADVVGLAGEIAVALLLGEKVSRITGTKAELNAGDILGFIEVKTRRRKTGFVDLCVNTDQIKRDSVYVNCIADEDLGFVEITGWAYGSEIEKKDVMTHKKNGHRFHIFKNDELHDVNSLINVVRERKKK